MSHIPYAELKKGTFLIASPDIQSGIFYRSVVLLCDHSAIGSFGLIINKPLDLELEEGMFGLDEEAAGSYEMRSGGPNQPNQILLLQSRGTEGDASLEVCPGVYLNGDGENPEDEEHAPLPRSLVCLGYGGWASGVLEREFLSGAWFLCPATSEHVFETPPEALWQTLLRSMGGKYKTLSLLPENLELN